MDGVLVIDKPAGPTSHDVVARARRALGETRIGHTGTLDPLATGVLPLVIGKATRLASLLSSTDKAYDAGIRLGASTDTYDAAGTVSAGGPAGDFTKIQALQVEEVLSAFRGRIEQMPPPYSAKKVGGVPAYKLARKQKPTALAAAPVTVHELILVGMEAGLVRLRLVASAGFYVRSLAHDLGVRLGCGAHLETLRRTRAGRFGLDVAVALEDLDRTPRLAEASLIPLGALVPDIPAVRVNDRGATRVSHGNSLGPEDLADAGPGRLPEGARVRVVDGAGRLLAIADAGPDALLRPSVVLV
ncbi:MAG TPA: tRNA pseudouridine(55) synthase TruB [Vicinamibacterales bacterium]|nr:tRNA pseudouridine(55) synthase TruB [Vicinamibacterales bacterium]